MLTVTYNGDSVSLYKDGELIGKQRIGFGADADPILTVGRDRSVGPRAPRLRAGVKNFTIRRGALDDQEVKKLFEDNPPTPMSWAGLRWAGTG